MNTHNTAVVGLDLSLTATGVARIANGETITRLVKSKPDDGTLRAFVNRSARIVAEVAELLDDDTLVVIEGPSFGSKSKMLDKIYGHWWMTVEDLCRFLTREPVVVPPTVRAKYATGKGNASKDEVLAAVIRRYPDVEITNNNTADALVLAAMGARHLGRPLEPSLPALNLTAMDSVRWTV